MKDVRAALRKKQSQTHTR